MSRIAIILFIKLEENPRRYGYSTKGDPLKIKPSLSQVGSVDEE